MTITINFVKMPGDKQIESITLRVDTWDYALAVAQAVEFAKTVTSAEIKSIHLDK